MVLFSLVHHLGNCCFKYFFGSFVYLYAYLSFFSHFLLQHSFDDKTYDNYLVSSTHQASQPARHHCYLLCTLSLFSLSLANSYFENYFLSAGYISAQLLYLSQIFPSNLGENFSIETFGIVH